MDLICVINVHPTMLDIQIAGVSNVVPIASFNSRFIVITRLFSYADMTDGLDGLMIHLLDQKQLP
jgi:hypothetical protein